RRQTAPRAWPLVPSARAQAKNRASAGRRTRASLAASSTTTSAASAGRLAQARRGSGTAAPRRPQLTGAATPSPPTPKRTTAAKGTAKVAAASRATRSSAGTAASAAAGGGWASAGGESFSMAASAVEAARRVSAPRTRDFKADGPTHGGARRCPSAGHPGPPRSPHHRDRPGLRALGRREREEVGAGGEAVGGEAERVHPGAASAPLEHADDAAAAVDEARLDLGRPLERVPRRGRGADGVRERRVEAEGEGGRAGLVRDGYPREDVLGRVDLVVGVGAEVAVGGVARR